MKSKIIALSKNEEFKNLLKQKKFSNKYVTIFFGNLMNKDNKKLNISFVTKKKLGNAVKRNIFLLTAFPNFFFVTKLILSFLLSLFIKLPKKIVTYLFENFFCLSKFLNSSFFERAIILLFINLH